MNSSTTWVLCDALDAKVAGEAQVRAVEMDELGRSWPRGIPTTPLVRWHGAPARTAPTLIA